MSKPLQGTSPHCLIHLMPPTHEHAAHSLARAPHVEIAAHTMNHLRMFASTPEDTVAQEIEGQRDWLVNTCGVPDADVVGFRSPYLIHSPTQRQVGFVGGWVGHRQARAPPWRPVRAARGWGGRCPPGPHEQGGALRPQPRVRPTLCASPRPAPPRLLSCTAGAGG